MLSLSKRLIVRDRLRAEVAADDVAAQRQRQAGLLLPPDAEIDDQVQPLILERELPLVDDEAGVESPVGDRVEDLVERHHFVGEPVRQQQPQRQKRRGQRAGHGDA